MWKCDIIYKTSEVDIMSYIYEYGVKFNIIGSDNQNTTKSSLEKIFFMMLNSKKKCFMSQIEIVNKVNKRFFINLGV